MTEPRDTCLRFIAAFWKAASEQTNHKFKASDADPYFLGLGKHVELFAVSDEPPQEHPDLRCAAAMAFSPARRAVWMNSWALDELATIATCNVPGPDPIAAFFYDSKIVRRRLQTFVEKGKCETWWQRPETQATFSRWIPPGAVVVHGVNDAILWIGIRSEEELRNAPEAQPERYTARLRTRASTASLAALLDELDGKQRVLLLEQRLSGDQGNVEKAAEQLSPEKLYARGNERLVREEPLVTRLLSEYYADGADASLVAYDDGKRTRDVGLVTRREWTLSENPGLTFSSQLVEDPVPQPPVTPEDRERHWERADSLGLELEKRELYSLRSIGRDGLLSFGMSDFFTYRSTYGAMHEELLLDLGEDHPDTGEAAFRQRQVLRNLLLADRRTILDVAGRLCAGGVIVLFAARQGDHAIIYVQERASSVSDAQGQLTVVPKGVHQHLVDPVEEVDLACSVFREFLEELRRGKPEGKDTYADPRSYRRDPAVLALEESAFLQPLGLVFDMIKGNFHACYCLYTPHETWLPNRYAIQWNEEKGGSTIPPLATTNEIAMTHLLARRDWAPEAYFTFIEGLRWLATQGVAVPPLPRLALAP